MIAYECGGCGRKVQMSAHVVTEADLVTDTGSEAELPVDVWDCGICGHDCRLAGCGVASRDTPGLAPDPRRSE